MATFNLNAAFTNEQLEVLHMTGTNVVVAKPTGGASPNVAWQVFKPMQANTLSWNEEYGIYASTSEVTNGAKLSQLSATKIGTPMNKLFTLEPSGSITGPVSGGTPDSFAMLNNYNKKYMTIGLYQNANVNGTEIIGNALSAVPVIKASTAFMTPFTTVYIWLQSDVISNTVVTRVTSGMSKLVFGGGVNTIDVEYDSDSGFFIATGASKAKLKESSIRHLAASL